MTCQRVLSKRSKSSRYKSLNWPLPCVGPPAELAVPPVPPVPVIPPAPPVPALLSALLPPVAEPAKADEPAIAGVPPLPAIALGASLLLEHAIEATEVTNRQPIAAEKRDG